MTTDILSDDDKARIFHEESLRLEIRRQLAPPADAPHKRWHQHLWAGMNSQFGQWFLSAVVLSGTIAAVTHYREVRKEAARKQEVEQAHIREAKELRERVTLEISHRFSATMSQLRAVSIRFGDRTGPDADRAIATAFETWTRPASDSRPPLFAEFKSHSGPALIAEMRLHAEGGGQKQKLKDILGETSALINETLHESPNRTAKAAAALLLDRMRYGSWSNGFPYTDCKNENPFC